MLTVSYVHSENVLTTLRSVTAFIWCCCGLRLVKCTVNIRNCSLLPNIQHMPLTVLAQCLPFIHLIIQLHTCIILVYCSTGVAYGSPQTPGCSGECEVSYCKSCFYSRDDVIEPSQSDMSRCRLCRNSDDYSRPSVCYFRWSRCVGNLFWKANRVRNFILCLKLLTFVLFV